MSRNEGWFGRACVRLCLCLLMLGIGRVAVAGETLGLWVFNGTPGSECVSGTEIQNLVSDSPLHLVTGKSTSGSAEVYEPRYVADVPGKCLHSDWTLTNKIADLTTSLLVSTGEVRDVGSYIRMTGLKAALDGKSFYIEMLAKPAQRNTTYDSGYGYSDNVVMGISGTSESFSPQVYYGEYNKGVLAVAGNEPPADKANHVQVAPLTWVYDDNQVKAFYNNEWHHLVLQYDRTAKSIVLWFGNRLSNAEVKWKDGDTQTDLVLEDDTFFQILGTIGRMKKCFYDIRIAALRVCEGTFSQKEQGLRVTYGHEYDDDPVVGWWRFSGALGGQIGDVSNEVDNVPPVHAFKTISQAATPAYVLDNAGSKTTRATGYKMYYGSMPKNSVKKDSAAKEKIANVSGSVTSDAERDAKPTLQGVQGGWNIFNFQEASMGSFTAECLCLFQTNLCNSLGVDGRTVIMAETTGYNDGNDGRWCVCTWQNDPGKESYVLVNASVINEKTGVRTAAFIGEGYTPELNKWHHLAFVYDESGERPTAKFYVDYKQVNKTYEFEEGTRLMREPQVGRYHLAGAPTRGQNGGLWGGFDEFRVTRKALPPEKFLRMCNDGGLIVICR